MSIGAKMTGWYDPGQLLRTGRQVLVSTLFGRNADPRLLEALASPDQTFCDFSKDDNGRPREEIWIDYAADVGDGFDSTYTVAYYLSRPQLRLKTPGGEGEYDTPLNRGDLLVLGGDEVYPVSSRQAYATKLVSPYEAALRTTCEPHPAAFAIPGNHDWYDSLVSFTRLFASGRWFAGWQTQQRRSYFAIKLPHGWWLVGTDVQLFSDIDAPQVEYFRKVAGHMKEGDRVILCNAEPHWIYAKIYGKDDTDFNEANLAFLEENVLKRKIVVFLSGDLHHYRRHATSEKVQKITAGGGGAFLHPTHGPDVEELAGGFRLQSCFPDIGTSKRICWRNLWFLFYNPTFGVLPAVLYLLTAWTVMANVGTCGLRDIGLAVTTTIHAALQGPAAVFWGVALFLGFVLFTDTHSKLYRWTAGPVHGAFHVLAAFFIGWGATYWTVSGLHLQFGRSIQLLLAGAAIFAGGWIAGSIIMGVYLLISLNVFHRHSNEAFSALKIADWKNFLKMEIDRDGTLTIFPIGIRKVPRRWTAGGDGPKLIPADGTPPELIEDPVELPAR